MKFPVANVSLREWNPREDILLYVLIDPYIYRNDDKLYREFYYNQKFVDSEGEIYKIIDKRLPSSIWRSIFRFLPNVFKIELIFITTNEKMGIEEVREFYLHQINNLPKEDYINEWINQIKDAKSIKEILGGV